MTNHCMEICTVSRREDEMNKYWTVAWVEPKFILKEVCGKHLSWV